jgi:AcrR family transcriptional regulator
MARLAAAAGISVRSVYRMFGSREAILRELDRRAPPTARERIIQAAAGLVDRDTLGGSTMDDVAAAAGVSRATLYRLFPGKRQLLKALIREHSPWDGAARVIQSMADRRPEDVIPAVAREMLARMTGRTGLLLSIGFDLRRQDSRTSADTGQSIATAFSPLLEYLLQEMAAGRVREADPVVTLNLLTGPILACVIARALPFDLASTASLEDDVDEIVRAWFRATAPGRHDVS